MPNMSKNQAKLTNADGGTGTDPNTWMAMENYYHGPYRAVTNELRTQYDPECCQSTFETPVFIALPQNYHHRGSHSIIPKRIWPHEGIPEQIITNQGPQFVAQFMKELYWLLKITGVLLTTYHPQMDGQMERVNQEVEVYLCAFINHHQDDWEDWLPAVVFSWNLKPGLMTQSLFEATKGYQPTMGPEPSRKGKEREAVRFVEEIEGVFKEMEATLKEAASDMKRCYNCRQWLDDLKIGNEVWLDAQDLWTDHPNKKLDYKQVGPFKIISKHGPMVYKLWLPKMYKVHPIFSAVKLTKAKDDKWERPMWAGKMG